MDELTKKWWKLLSKESPLNLFGKIISFPMIVFVGMFWTVLDFLFLKKEEDGKI